MTNFELIDDFLTNRLGEQEKLEFERQLGSDPSLKADVDLQKHILEGVKRARIADLKAMLNNVPVGGGISSGVATGKIAAAIVAAGIIGTSLYFVLKSEDTSKAMPPAVSQKVEPPPSSAIPKIKETVDVQEPAHQSPAKIEPRAAKKRTVKTRAATEKSSEKNPAKEKVSASSAKEKKSAKAKQPKLDVVDPSSELVENSTTTAHVAESQKSVVTLSHIVVETNSTDKNYTFHYQFKEGNLVLYGTFDKSLYEILEIHGDRHAVFLFYKDSYYLLDEKQTNITSLLPIRDHALLRKLKEYRIR